jgi:hypothetical protein
MVAIRCTQKLLARIGAPSPVTEPATTVLGDWYARPVAIGHQRLILLISEYSRLPVLMRAQDVKHLAGNFPDHLALVLFCLGIDAAAVNREVEATRGALIAKTESRSLLGTLNDFTHMLQWQLPDDPGLALLQAALKLSHTPVRPLGRLVFPDKAARELFAQA